MTGHCKQDVVRRSVQRVSTCRGIVTKLFAPAPMHTHRSFGGFCVKQLAKQEAVKICDRELDNTTVCDSSANDARRRSRELCPSRAKVQFVVCKMLFAFSLSVCLGLVNVLL